MRMLSLASILKSLILIFQTVMLGAQSASTPISVPNPGAIGFPSLLSGKQLGFYAMMPNANGLVVYSIQAIKGSLHPGIRHPDEDPPPPVYYETTVNLYSYSYNWTPNPGFAPVQIFGVHSVTVPEILATGHVTQSQIAALGIPDPEGTNGLVSLSFQESSLAADNGLQNLYPFIDAENRVKGTLNLVVDIPQSGLWRLGVTSAMGEERYAELVLGIGPQILQVTDVEAGNCLTSRAIIDSNNALTGFHRETSVLVRKNLPGLAVMSFVSSPIAQNRYRLDSIQIGNNSQSLVERLPIQQGRDAMLRIMAYDAMGVGENTQPVLHHLNYYVTEANGTVTYNQSFDSLIGTKLVNSGRLYGERGPGPVIPGAYIKPGITITVRLLDGITNQELDRLPLSVNVIAPRHIIIHGYDVRPIYGDSGCPAARNGIGEMSNWILPSVQEVFPFSTIEYKYEGKVILADYAFPPAHGVITTATAMIIMNTMQGFHPTDTSASTEHLYLAMINQKYSSASSPGMAWYGYRGLAVTRIDGDPHPGPFDEALGYAIAHEMGHCFGLEHAPSRGAEGSFLGFSVNRVDTNYPYGGAGLAGGWGYSSKGNYFLAENSQILTTDWANSNLFHPNWDPMSYTFLGLRDHTQQRFSDTYSARLLPGMTGNQCAYPSPASFITFSQHPTGILVLGSTGASQIEQWWGASDEYRSNHPGNQTLTLEPYPSTDPLIGYNPMNGDIDDPTPPILIVTKIPRIVGVNY